MNNPLKRTDYSTRNQKKRYLESEIRRILALAESGTTEKYLNGPFATRRKNAILNYLERAEEEFKNFGLFSVVESFSENELVPVLNYNRLDSEFDIRIAASLWILDHLRAAGKMREAYDLLPDVSMDLDAWYLPVDFSHPCYSVELIHSVIHAMSMRYPRRSCDDMIITEDNARGKKPSEIWLKLMDLIPKEDVKAACDTFKEKIWELSARIMKGMGWYDRALAQTVKEICLAGMGSTAPFEKPVPERKEKPVLMPDIPSPGRIPLGTLPGIGGSLFSDFLEETDTEPDTLSARGMELLDKKRYYILDFDDYLQMDRKSLRRGNSRDVVDTVAGFTVEDPYELCFALIYLLDDGDDAPWLFRSGYSLILFALRMLPWFMDEGDWTDEELEAWYGGMEYNRNGWLDKGLVPDRIDYYHTKHNGKNYAQIIYEMSRGVVPKGLHPFEEERLKLVEEGMEEDIAQKLTDTAELLFLYNFQAKQYTKIADDWEDDEYEEEDREESGRDPSSVKLGGYWGRVAAEQGLELSGEDSFRLEPSIEDQLDLRAENSRLQSELEAVKKQIKSLRSTLAKTRQEYGNERSKYEHDLKIYRQDHRELADLRELVFHSELAEEEQERREKPQKQYEFPYDTKKRTVIFGGHDSFLRVIKPMLPTVKFVDARNLTYSPEIIRNSDVVWIQNNCISHSQYWSIVKHCKLAGVQMRYFVYASAEKCAEQLVTEDLK